MAKATRLDEDLPYVRTNGMYDTRRTPSRSSWRTGACQPHQNRADEPFTVKPTRKTSVAD
jgi:hypothetical protein